MTRLAHSYNNDVTVDGKSLCDARCAVNMSLQEVANVLGCNKSQVSRWEQGTQMPSEERIYKMVKMFGTGIFVIQNTKKVKR